ncbi:MAG: DUF1365 domain-containing protein, partial [Planctomycetes bacterium]|nr:DUF1365 domain-containing protein [Planctomycetota bacterium]
MRSGILEGRVIHDRVAPVPHRFRVRLFLMALELAELDRVFRGRWLWSTRWPAIAWFRRADHLGDRRKTLDDAVRDLVAERAGRRPAGPICLVTHLRYFGVVMNPVSFYLVRDEAQRPEWIVAHVSNTPWNERHAYLLRCDPDRRVQRFRFDKAFHVSPFQSMEQTYD